MVEAPWAVLISGGLDSAILLGQALQRRTAVQPIFVRFGLHWEDVERAFLERYLHALRCPALRSLVVIDQPVRDIYGPHWSITGDGVPNASAPDEAVFLPGRNVLLLAKPLLWCHRNEVPTIALGSLQTNPFPDATPEFFQSLQSVVNQAIGGRVAIELPFGGMKKTAVMQLGRDLPLEHTFSCIRPAAGLHCGRCNKCAERQRAFADAKMADPTRYG
jgi:7-cyano-7-deazaguanine synthase